MFRIPLVVPCVVWPQTELCMHRPSQYISRLAIIIMLIESRMFNSFRKVINFYLECSYCFIFLCLSLEGVLVSCNLASAIKSENFFIFPSYVFTLIIINTMKRWLKMSKTIIRPVPLQEFKPYNLFAMHCGPC